MTTRAPSITCPITFVRVGILIHYIIFYYFITRESQKMSFVNTKNMFFILLSVCNIPSLLILYFGKLLHKKSHINHYWDGYVFWKYYFQNLYVFSNNNALACTCIKNYFCQISNFENHTFYVRSRSLWKWVNN